jgi:ADP-heptose:LPS heptosyltransferase
VSPGLLIVHPGALGDVVLVFGLIRALRERFRPIGLLAQAGIAALAAAEGLADDAFALESAWTATLFAGMPDDRARTRLSPYTRALAFARSAGLAASLQALAPEGVCTVPPRPPLESDQHATAHAWARARAGNLLPAGAPEAPPIPPYRSTDGSLPVFLHPGSGSPRKRWPTDRFLAVAAALQARGHRVEVVLGPADLDLRHCLPVTSPLHQPPDVVALRDLLRTGAAFIGNDSGVAHLAAWLGLACVAVFGPSDPQRWRPIGERVAVVRSPGCGPCFEASGADCGGRDCLSEVAPEDVLRALDRLMNPSDPSDRTEENGA